MKTRRPIGITILTLIGILYGIFYLFLGIINISFKSLFAVFHAVDRYICYLASLSFFVLACLFFISSLGLLIRREWARKLFLLSVLGNIAFALRWFARYVVDDTPHEVSPINLTILAELFLVLGVSILCFWYVNRTNVRMYLTSSDNTINTTK
jgi:NADH:ubiquinone oxidoreductase subunit K